MRVGHGMITAALAGLYVACARPTSDVHGGHGATPSPETPCEARCACEGCSADDEAVCRGEQEAMEERAEERQCQDELAAYNECVRLEGRCVNGHYVTDACDAHEAALSRCLAPEPTCPTVGNGICDEPQGTGRCPAGTDTEDCRGYCPFTENGVCDEPEGTGRCAEGTDVEDCKPATCDSVGDNICDEPEGTGRCAEGTDVEDCNRSRVCDMIRECGDATTGCTACAIEQGCSDELNACASDDACIAFTQCAVTCGRDELCLDNCAATHPAGAALHNAYIMCVTCEFCYISCAGALMC